MAILVTGGTGAAGRELVAQLACRGAQVRVLTRSPEKADFPDGVSAVRGELTDVAAMREALKGVTGTFLLSAVTPDELTGTLITLSLARAAGVRDFVYLSVIHADAFTDPAHFAAKAAAERMISEFDLAATVLRPGYYMQNDVGERDRLYDGTYASPVGNRAVLKTDVRDLAEVAALSLLRRHEADRALPREVLDVVAPQILTGDAIAAIWTDVLGRPVRYGGDDLNAFEQQMGQFAPDYLAYDMRLMMRRFQVDGMVAAPGTQERLDELLGRPIRSYADFAAETAASWK